MDATSAQLALDREHDATVDHYTKDLHRPIEFHTQRRVSLRKRQRDGQTSRRTSTQMENVMQAGRRTARRNGQADRQTDEQMDPRKSEWTTDKRVEGGRMGGHKGQPAGKGRSGRRTDGWTNEPMAGSVMPEEPTSQVLFSFWASISLISIPESSC